MAKQVITNEDGEPIGYEIINEEDPILPDPWSLDPEWYEEIYGDHGY